MGFAFTVLLMALIEIGLRIGGLFSPEPLFIPVPDNPAMLQTNSAYGKKYFTENDFIPMMPPDRFSRTKTENTIRLFALGASTTAGFPYFENGAFPRILKRELEIAYPDKEFEVINLGMTATNSFTLLEIIDQVLEQNPDAILVYAGHNEIYGAFGAASSETPAFSRPLTLLHFRLMHVRIYRAIQQLVHYLRNRFRKSADGVTGTRTLMHRMVSNDSIPENSPVFNRAYQNYKKNLEELVKKASRKQVPVFISTLVSNQRDLPPFISTYIHDDSRFWNQVQKLRSEYMQHQMNDKMKFALQELFQLDSTVADLHFLRGRMLLQEGTVSLAARFLTRAKDLDGLRFRAHSLANYIIRDICARNSRCFLVDAEKIFSNAAKDGIPGNDLFLEHVHPTIEGVLLLSHAFRHELQAQGIISSSGRDTALTDSLLLENIGWNPFDQILARINMFYLLQDWPFVRNRYGIKKMFRPSTEEEKIVYDAYIGVLFWEQARIRLANLYVKEGKTSLAIREYKALQLARPYVLSYYLKLGTILLKSGRVKEARYWLARGKNSVGRQHEWLNYYYLLALIATAENNMKEAIKYYRLALEIYPNDPRLWYNCGGAYYTLKQYEQAKECFEMVLSLHPGNSRAKIYLKEIEKLMNKSYE